MGIESVSLPEILSNEVEALVKSGYYSSKSDVIKDALRNLLESKPNLRISSAVEMYNLRKASLAKCAEIAGVSTIGFKGMLAERGIIRKISSENLKKGVELIRKLRK